MGESSTPIDFHKGPRGRYHAVLHRFDGVSVRLEGGSYNRIGGEVGRVPHDIAHLIVEDVLGLEAGLWGTLAAGGMVQNATFAEGRRPPHAERQGRTIAERSGESLRQAEILVQAAADASRSGRTRDLQAFRGCVGARWAWPSTTADALERACSDLCDAAGRWDGLADGSVLRLVWQSPRTVGRSAARPAELTRSGRSARRRSRRPVR